MTATSGAADQTGQERLHVLIIEDNLRDAKLIVHELKRAGFNPEWVVVHSEEEYIARLENVPEIILADGSLPDFNAARALDLLRERNLTTPLIVVTGSLSDERAVEYMKHGAADYLLKDRLARLGQAVRHVIEKRRLTEEAQRVQEERNRYFSLSVDMICIAGFDGYFKLLNPAWEATLGWTTQELLDRPYLELLHPDDLAASVQELQKVIVDGDKTEFENRYECKDGSYKWLSWKVAPDLARKVIYGTVRDATERKQIDQKVRSILESAPDAMIIVDTDGLIALVNNQSETVFGYKRDEILGKPIEMLLPERYRDKHIGHRENFASGPRIRRMGAGLELYGRRKDGREFPVEISLSPLETEDGVLTVTAIRDVTENKLLENQLRQAQKMEAIGQLAGGVAHDFNNLLTIINGYSDLLLQKLPHGDPMRELLEEIHHAGERSATLTRQLLAFSRQQVISPRALDLGALIGDTEKMLRRLIGEDIRLEVTNDPGLWPIKSDPGQMEQIVLNLAVNARDAMPKGGMLTIETRNHEPHGIEHERSVLLSITDNGTGMNEATKSQIFLPFFTTKGEKGTGLGLATVYGIVKQGNGRIEVESELGQGTTFKLYFPAVAEQYSTGKSSPGLRLMPGGTETIFLVEDDDGVRALTRHILKRCGYELLEARDGLTAIELALKYRGPIHLLLTDVIMPGLGGRETADRVVASHPEARVLFLSGYTDDAILRHGVRQAETAFLQKPFSPSTLAQRIREVLDEGVE